MHGISNSRAYGHRVGLYKVLLSCGYKVLAVDYRGFADASKTKVTEETLVEDGRVVIDWVRKRLRSDDKMLVWGHSLGAAIACRAVAEEQIESFTCAGVNLLVLESPFNNLHDAVVDALKSKGKLVAVMFNLKKQMRKAVMLFQSDKWIKEVTSPTVILHAEDDDTVDVELGKKLFKAARDGGKETIDLITLNKLLILGHNNIFQLPTLGKIINNYTFKKNT